MNGTEHFGPLEVFGFIEGGLDEPTLAWVWNHLDACGECVRFLADVIKAARPPTAEEESVLKEIARLT